MILTYLDTSALMRRAEYNASNPTPRNQLIRPHLEALLADSSRQLACSEITLMEFHSNLNQCFRGGGSFDFDWYMDSQAQVFGEIASGQILVLPTPARAFEHAMAMVAYASRELGRAFHSWDATHLSIASRWAYDESSSVEIISSDSDFQIALEISDFNGRVSVLNLDVLASTGEGLDAPGKRTSSATRAT